MIEIKLPHDSVIPLEKLIDYMLVPLARADKSAFLDRAGDSRENPEQLPPDATPVGSTRFGDFFEMHGPLREPNDVALRVSWAWESALAYRTIPGIVHASMPLITLNRINKGGEIVLNSEHIVFIEYGSQ